MEDAAIHRIMPNNPEAEQAVIGSMLMDQEAISIASEQLTDEDFYNPRFKVLFQTIVDLYRSGSAVDVITLAEKLKENKVPDEIGSVEFISNVISSVPTSANIKYYCNIVANKALLRRLIRTSESITTRAYQDSTDIEELMEDTEHDIFEVVNSRSGSEDFTPIRDVALATLADIQSAAMSDGTVTGISTGFTDLDYKTAGLQPSDLILIAARPSMGKTAFALNIAEYVAMINNLPTAIFSLEMSKVQLAKRLISMNSKVDSQHIRTGKLQDDEWSKILLY